MGNLLSNLKKEESTNAQNNIWQENKHWDKREQNFKTWETILQTARQINLKV